VGGGSSSVEALFTANAAKGVLQLQQYRANFSRRGGLGEQGAHRFSIGVDEIFSLYPGTLAKGRQSEADLSSTFDFPLGIA